MLDKQPDLIAVAWYRAEVYDRFVALAPDGGGMEKTFDEWKQLAEATMVKIMAQGIRIIRIDMNPDDFTAWLRRNNLKSAPDTRARYVLEIANRNHGTH